MKDEAAQEWSDEAGPELIRLMKIEVPVKTGALQRSHRQLRLQKVIGGWLLRIVADKEYSVPVHQGSEGRTVVVGGFIAGGSLKAKIITRQHKGRRSNPWMVRAMQRAGLTNVQWVR